MNTSTLLTTQNSDYEKYFSQSSSTNESSSNPTPINSIINKDQALKLDAINLAIKKYEELKPRTSFLKNKSIELTFNTILSQLSYLDITFLNLNLIDDEGESLHIKTAVYDYSIYFEIFPEENSEIQVVLTLYKNKIPVLCFDGDAKQTSQRLIQEIEQAKAARKLLSNRTHRFKENELNKISTPFEFY
jgi:hypothetical protein